MASLAAILAIGNRWPSTPAPLDARPRVHLDDDDPAVAGWMANWMLQPPVSTPTSRMMSMPTSRIRWYSRSVRVSAGATVMESPVCTPIGSRFSMEQTTTTLSAVAHDLEFELLPPEDGLLEELRWWARGLPSPPRSVAGRPRRRPSRAGAPIVNGRTTTG